MTRIDRTFAATAFVLLAWLAISLVPLAAGEAAAPEALPGAEAWPWWSWPVLLFLLTFVIGIVAVMGGVGGGVLFVPLVSGFFPFHIDFVRAAGLMVALATSLAAGPSLLQKGLADLRLAMPLALVASSTAIVGAMIGLALNPAAVQVCLGLLILGICALMFATKRSEIPEVAKVCPVSTRLGIGNSYVEESTGETVAWRIRNYPLGMAVYGAIGMVAGMFGLGAGWASVPALNLVMGVPLKIAVATSILILSTGSSAAVWIYINKGCLLPLIVVPSILGSMLGSRVGSRLLSGAKPSMIRWIVIVILALAGARSFLKGIGI